MTFQSYKGFILGDQGADSGGKGKSKWGEKRWRELFFEPFFSHPFRLSPAPTICSWVSEDGRVFLKNIISCCLQHRRHLEFQKATHTCAFCSCLGISAPFATDTSLKRIDQEGLRIKTEQVKSQVVPDSTGSADQNLIFPFLIYKCAQFDIKMYMAWHKKETALNVWNNNLSIQQPSHRHKKPSARAVLGNIGPWLWQYGPCKARLVSCLLYGTRLLIVKCTSGGLHLKGFLHDVFLMTWATQTKASYHAFEKQIHWCEIVLK